MLTFRKIPTFEEAKEIEFLLNNEGIETELKDDVPLVDVTFTSRTEQNPVILKLKSEDFEKAKNILKEFDLEILKNISKDHYLYEFNDAELYDILYNPEDWNHIDYLLAQKLLRDKGHTVDDESLLKIKNEKIAKLSKPQSVSKTLINIGYVFAFLGGFAGIVIGYSIYFNKKTVSNGEQVHSYSEESRKHGQNIFYIGIIIFILLLGYKIATLA